MAAATPLAPVTRIRASRGWMRLDLGEVLAYRELLGFFIWRDLKIRYKQTALGALWAILQPLGLALVLTFVLGRVSGLAPTGIPYAAFALSGLVPWTLVSQGVIRSSDSLVAAANLLQKVFFPRLLLPIAAVGLHLIDYGLALVVLILVCVGIGVVPGVTALWVVPLSAYAALIALSIGIGLSAVNVRYRDVRAALPFLVQLWLFASPIAYAVGLIPSWARSLYELNPVVGLVEGFRWALFQQGPAPIEAIALGFVVTAVLLALGLAYFTRVERTFADVI